MRRSVHAARLASIPLDQLLHIHELGRVFCDAPWTSGASPLVRSCSFGTALTNLRLDSTVRHPADRAGDDLTACCGAHFRSADELLLAHYSPAVHVIDPRSGERVAQGDTGIGPGFIVPFRSEIDISALPPGDYEVRVALYDWQTGERLSARDLETDEVSDMHTLHRFRLD